MARYTGPKDKRSRAAGTKLFLKGERDLSPKSGISRRPYRPGQHGAKRVRAKSEYGSQLLEKQKVKWVYGIMEKQFRRYIEIARKHKGVTGEMLVQQLEGRLDNVIYRLGFAPSRSAARQMVSHGHITVNKKKVAIPSYEVRLKDRIGIREGSRSKKLFGELPLTLKKHVAPVWLQLFQESLEGEVKGVPTTADANIPADIQKIIEFYSR